jgi:hypothetical protein
MSASEHMVQVSEWVKRECFAKAMSGVIMQV